MADIEVKDILRRIEQRQKQWGPLFERMGEDYRLWRLENPYKAAAGYQSFCGNEPRTLADKIRDVGMQAQLEINIDLEGKGDKKKKQLAERYILGVLYQNDIGLQAMGMPELLDTACFYGVVRGLLCGRVLVYKAETKGSTMTEIEMLDPLHVLWGKAKRSGLPWVAYRRYEYGVELDDEFGTDLKRDDELCLVWDWWDREKNIVFIVEERETRESSSIIVLKEAEPHGKKHLPFVLHAIGGTPLVVDPSIPDSIRDWAESCYAANRKIYEESNRLDSYTMDMIERNRKRPMMLKSPDGRWSPNEDILLAGQQISVASDQDIRPIDVPGMPADTNIMRARIELDKERGGMPGISFGQQRYEASGEALALLSQGQMSVVSPLLKGLGRFYRGIAHELISQFQEGGYKAVKLSGYDKGGKRFEMTEIKPSDLSGEWEIDVKVVPRLAAEDRVRWATAGMAKGLGLPDEIIWEDILKLQDSQKAIAKRWSQAAEQMFPEIGLMQMMKALYEEGREPEAKMVGQKFIELIFEKWQKEQGMGGGGVGGQGIPQTPGTPLAPPGGGPPLPAAASPMGGPPVPGVSPGLLAPGVSPGTPGTMGPIR